MSIENKNSGLSLVAKNGFNYRGREVIAFTCTDDRTLCRRPLPCSALVPVEFISKDDPAGLEALQRGGICDRIIENCGAEVLGQTAEIISVPVNAPHSITANPAA